MSTKLIAAIVTDLDSLLLPRHIDSQQLAYFVHERSPILPWIRRFLPDLFVMSYSMHERISITDCYIHDILASSNIIELMKREQIYRILPTQKVTEELAEIAVQTGINLIGPSFIKMQQFENKIWFDRFMKKHGVPSPRSVVSSSSSVSIELPIVVQESASWGSEGTYIINKPDELKKLDAEQIFLIREFVQGTTYGITVCITNAGIWLSALRIQCSTANAHFSGIQWVPTAYFSQSVQRKLCSIFGQLGTAMKAVGYIGWASFDFIIDDVENVFVIECNPRFTAASAHIVADPSLCGLDSLHDVLIPHSAISKGLINISSVPVSSFQGATLEICIDAKIPFTLLQPGVYEMKNKRIKYKYHGIDNYQNDPGSMFFYTDARNGEVHPESTVAGVVVSHIPLYDESGRESDITRKIMNFFTMCEKK